MPQVTPEQAEYDMLMSGQPQLTDPTSALYAENMKEEKITNILSQINPDNLLADIEYRIRGYKKNTLTGERDKISKTTSNISEQLVANFMSFLGSILNQNTSMSNFSSGEINSIMENVIEYIADDLTVKDDEYGIVGEYKEM